MRSDKFKQKLAELFSYHPPKNQEEVAKHELVNKSCFELALILSEVIKDPAQLTVVLRLVDTIRMSANAAVAYERTGITFRDLFDEKPEESSCNPTGIVMKPET